MRLRSPVIFTFLSSFLLALSVGAQIESPTPDRSSRLKIGATRSYHDHSIRDIEAVGNRNIGCGRGFGNWYSLERQLDMGKRISQEVETTSEFIRDPVVTEYINQIGQNLVRNSDSQVAFRIRVIDSEEINAVALPGGFFYVDAGRILAAADEAELAGVMAHETVAKEGEKLPGPVQSEDVRVRGSTVLFQKDRFTRDEKLDGDDEFKIILERESAPSREHQTSNPNHASSNSK